MPRGSLSAAPVIDELLLPDEVEDYAANKVGGASFAYTENM